MFAIYVQDLTTAQTKAALTGLSYLHENNVLMVLPLFVPNWARTLVVVRNLDAVRAVEIALKTATSSPRLVIKSLPDAFQFKRPIVILAAPRSGSTLLFETLSRAPSVVTIGQESGHILEYRIAVGPEGHCLPVSEATPARVELINQALLASSFDRDGMLFTPEFPLTPRNNMRLLEKTPRNALRIPFINAVLPDALFIFLYRKPLANISSLLAGWSAPYRFTTHIFRGKEWKFVLPDGWLNLVGNDPAEISTLQWCSCNRAIIDWLSQLPRNRWIFVDYDNFIRAPREETERLCNFVGLEIDDQFRSSLTSPLPFSRTILTPPNPNKILSTIERIRPYISLTNAITEDIRAMK
jgi:hypothetical protein